MIPIFSAKNQNGIKFNKESEVRAYLRTLPEDVHVTIRRPRKIRSLDQNGYYFGCVLPILCETLGYSKDEMHESLKSLFLSESFEFVGRTITIVRSTASLKTDEFEAYLAKVRAWAASDESKPKIKIPLPNEVDC